MKQRSDIQRRPRRAMPMWVLASLVAGCDSFGAKPVETWGEVSETIDTGPVDPLILTSAHEGWKKQACLGCHDGATAYPHVAEAYVPPACVSCHGTNGAPHTNHATQANDGCKDCHGDVTHVATFTAPTDCVVCHYHPQAP